ncbi:hypothetical protein ERO13_D13G183450v2 [Gossypium hirsutum]|nr:hypothetical protein ERO13_D13G183450v2 [Gossypium hirsutum]
MIKKQETSWNILCLSPLVEMERVVLISPGQMPHCKGFALCLTVETRNKLEYFMFILIIPEDQEDVSRLSTVFEAQEKT